MGAPIFHSLDASEFFFRILYFLLWIRVAFFPSPSPIVTAPIIPVFNEPELSQTCALLLYSSYSMSCLEGVINDTMNPCLMHLYEALSQARTDAYTAIANALRDFNPSVMSAQQIIDYFTPKLGKVPLPPSMKRPNDFMASIRDTGLILELLVVDWRTLREVRIARFPHGVGDEESLGAGAENADLGHRHPALHVHGESGIQVHKPPHWHPQPARCGREHAQQKVLPGVRRCCQPHVQLSLHRMHNEYSSSVGIPPVFRVGAFFGAGSAHHASANLHPHHRSQYERRWLQGVRFGD